ncbi:S53 family peptidase [Streptacidiphilus carbonis]|uniref:S53 family peptidase n=1 Tax=Streptacidiphilus carbonis TaxID=105422 RepID=UPI0005AABD9A|nr:S53 family peptidase [Streptacidiphilus carbonis]
MPRRVNAALGGHAGKVALIAATAAAALFVGTTAAGAASFGPSGPSGTSAGSAVPQRVGAAARIPVGAVRTGAPAGGTHLTLSVGLEPRDTAALKAFVAAVSTKGSAQYHHYLAKGQFAAAFGPTADTVAKVTASLKAEGLNPGKVSADGLSIPVTTTLATAAHAFGTSFAGYRLKDGSTGYANSTAPQLAGNIAGYVSGVAGMDSLIRVHASHGSLSTAATAPTSTSTAGAVSSRTTTGGPQLCSAGTQALSSLGSDGHGYYSAGNLAASYGMEHTSTSGSGVTIGLLELEGFSSSDVAAYQSCYGTKAAVSTYKVDGGAKVAPNPDQNIGIESLLDIEDVVGLAPGASIIDYEGPDATVLDANGKATPNTAFTDDNLEHVYQAMIVDDRAQVLSTSWGGCELETSGALINAENYYFMEAAAQGQTVLAASGDDGASDCATKTGTSDVLTASADDPAGQPFVTGVGGTNLTGSPASARSTWNSGDGASGGGVSVWSVPNGSGLDYQSGFTGAGYTATPCGATSTSTCRQVPDVAALADPANGYALYSGGGWGRLGGTSGAAPTWAALTAIADTQSACKANGPLGFINPALYAAARSSYAADFSDITIGSNDIGNGGYSAGTGYDLATGLGEPKAAALTTSLCGSLTAPATGSGTYHAVTPTRLLDTRTGSIVPADGMTGVQIEGNAGIPATGVTSVVLNVTVTGTTGPGYLTAWGDGTTRPKTSNLNWVKGQTIANLVTVPVAADGAVDFFVAGSTQVIADVQGYYTNDTSGLTLSTQTPTRILDTRSAVGVSTSTPVTNGTISLKVDGLNGVPATAKAVVLNLTAVHTGSAGYLAAYPEGSAVPTVSNVNWSAANTVIAGLAIVPVGADGNVSIKVAGTGDVLADVFGYFSADAGGSSFTGTTPTRLLDTRAMVGVGTTTPLAGGNSVALQVTGRAGVPTGIKAVVLNVTVVGGATGGYLTAWADGSARPGSSNLNWSNSNPIPNQVIVPVGADGKVDLYVNATTHVIADVFGYYM